MRSLLDLSGRALRAGLLLAALAACGSDGRIGPNGPDGPDGPDGPGTPEPVASVAVTPNAHTLHVGETLRLTATARSARGAALEGRSVTWASEAPAIAAVGADGELRAVAVGTTAVSATVEGRKGTAQVTVVAVDGTDAPAPNPVPTISTLAPQQVAQGAADFVLTVRGASFSATSWIEWDGYPVQTTYVSATELRAIIAAAQVATARTVSVRVLSPTPGGGASTSLSFGVVAPAVASVRLAPTQGAAWTWVGDRLLLDVAALDASGAAISGMPVTLESADPSRLTVSGAGVRGVAPGRVRLTATAGGRSSFIWVTVFDAPAYDLVFDSRIAGRSQLYLQAPGEGNATANPLLLSVEAWDPAPSPDGQRIAFAGRGADGNTDIYVVHRDGTRLVRLTTAAGIDDEPTWSPDGSRIAFRSTRGEWSDIWVMNADGSSQTRLSVYGENEVRVPEDMHGEPAWSPDGTRIAYVRSMGLGGTVWIMNADGSGKRYLNTREDDHAPTWRGDGQALFVQRRERQTTALRLAEISASDGSPVYRVNTSYLGASPAASPDGRWIAYLSPVAGSGVRGVRVLPATFEEGPRTVVSELYGGGEHPAWIRRR